MVAPILAVAVVVPHPAFAEPPVSDEALAEMRGGFSGPGGLDISIAVQTDTRVDGNLVLRTVFRVDDGPASLRAYAPAPDAAKQTSTSMADVGSATDKPAVSVMFDRSNGVRFVQTSNAASAVAISNGERASLGSAPDGTPAADVVRDEAAVATPTGSLSLRSVGSGSRVTLEGRGLSISHLVGSSYGSVIANTSNDGLIDTATTVALDISGATTLNLGSALLRVESLGVDAVAQMIPR